MQAYRLIPHPDHPPLAVSAIEARIGGDHPNWLQLRWRIEGSGKLVLPKITGKVRADNLWQTTCFELFVKPIGGETYGEWNLSPSRQWAAYDFDSYRNGMRERPVERTPDCVMRPGSTFSIFDASIARAELPVGPCAIGLTAVIEEEGGVISYWALAHSEGKADFHHAACFAAKLDPRGIA